MLNSLLLFDLSLILVLLFSLLLLKSLSFERLFPLLLDLNSSLSLLFYPGLSDLFILDSSLFSLLSNPLCLDSSLFGLLLPPANLLLVPRFSLFCVLSLSLDLDCLPWFLLNSALLDLFFSRNADSLLVFSLWLFALLFQLIVVLFLNLLVALFDFLLSDALFLSLLFLISLPVARSLLLLVLDSDLLLLVSVVFLLLKSPLLVSLFINKPSFIDFVTSAFVSFLPKFITVLILIFGIFFFFFRCRCLYLFLFFPCIIEIACLNILFLRLLFCRLYRITIFLTEDKVVSIILFKWSSRYLIRAKEGNAANKAWNENWESH